MSNLDKLKELEEFKMVSFVMEYLNQFQPDDIDGDNVDLRFEVDGVDTGTDVSIVEQAGLAAKAIDTLIERLETAEAELARRDAAAGELDINRCDAMNNKKQALINFIYSAILGFEARQIYAELSRNENLQLESYRAALAALTAEPAARSDAAGEPDGYIFLHPNGKLFWSVSADSNAGQKDIVPFYFAAQPTALPPIKLPKIKHPAQFDYADELIASLKAQGFTVEGDSDE